MAHGDAASTTGLEELERTPDPAAAPAAATAVAPAAETTSPGEPGAAVAAKVHTVDRRDLLRRPWTLALTALGGALLAGCDFTSAPFDRLTHLLRRLTFGPTTSAYDRIDTIGEAAWLAEQLDPSSLDTSALDAKLALLPALEMTPVELFTTYPEGDEDIASTQLRLAAGIRAVESPAQLYERMVEFWSDHFNVPFGDRNQQLLKIVEDDRVIRVHALGKFKDLLLGSAASPAMLYYLDNYLSKVGAINENYGRELLELHTLGVGGGYTEDDVVSTARLFTGWTINPSTGEFRFVSANHDSAPLTIMGWTRPASGPYVLHGIDFLFWLAAQPQCAEFVCTKIARRFVSDNPDPGLVSAMASAWLANDSAVAPVLEAMVAHPSFDAAAGQKFRRPWDYLAFVLRALGASITPTTNVNLLAPLGAAIGGLGHMPFAWPAPNGYPDVEGAWLNTGAMIGRWNLAGDAVGNAFAPVDHDPSALRSSLTGKTAAEIYDLVSQALLLESTTLSGRFVLNQQLGWTDSLTPSSAQIDDALPTLLFAMLGSADAQYR